MFTARYLGPSNYGIIGYATSVVAFVAPIMKLGLNHVLVNEFVKTPDKEGEILGTTIFFNSVSALSCMIAANTFVCATNPNDSVTRIVCALYSINLLTQAFEMIKYWFQAKLASQYTSLTGLAAYVIVTIYRVYLLVTQKSIYWFAVTQSMDYLIISVVLLLFYRKLSNQKLTVSWNRFADMFSRSRYFIVSSMMITIFAQTDKIMLKMMITDEAVGIYTAAFTCAGMTSFIFSAIIDSFRPTIFEKKQASESDYENTLIGCYSVIIFFALAQSVVISAFSGLIIYILYGDSYTAAGDILRVLVWYTTFSYIGSVRNVWILAENKQKYLWIINLSGAVVNVILNLIMIPIMGVMGAAIASLVTQVFTNVIIGYIIKPIRYNNRLMFKSLNPKIMLGYSLTVLKRLKKR
jgi:O-antigen/teichoic acid export membrane protein